MEDMFRTHNQFYRLYADRDNLTAISLSDAIELVQKNEWEKNKRKYLVILPDKKKA